MISRMGNILKKYIYNFRTEYIFKNLFVQFLHNDCAFKVELVEIKRNSFEFFIEINRYLLIPLR